MIQDLTGTSHLFSPAAHNLTYSQMKNEFNVKRNLYIYIFDLPGNLLLQQENDLNTVLCMTNTSLDNEIK